jgi:hypothetical protein
MNQIESSTQSVIDNRCGRRAQWLSDGVAPLYYGLFRHIVAQQRTNVLNKATKLLVGLGEV